MMPTCDPKVSSDPSRGWARSDMPTRPRGGRVRAVLATGATALLAAVTVGCSADPDESTRPSGTNPPTAAHTVPAPLPPDLGDSTLEPGRYVVSVADAPEASLLPVLSLPEGYRAVPGGVGVEADDPSGDDDVYLRVWEVNSVYEHPCDLRAGPSPVGPTVTDLADVLAAHPLRHSTDPVAVSIGDYEGLYVELTPLSDTDIYLCREQGFSLWPGWWQQFPDQVDLVWIIDVDGQHITFDASHMLNVSPRKVAEIRDIVATATFVPAAGNT